MHTEITIALIGIVGTIIASVTTLWGVLTSNKKTNQDMMNNIKLQQSVFEAEVSGKIETLTTGKWGVTGTASYVTNGTGRRHISVTTDSSSIASRFPQSMAAFPGLNSYLSASGVFEVTAGSQMIYLDGLQNSGTALSPPGGKLVAILIA